MLTLGVGLRRSESIRGDVFVNGRNFCVTRNTLSYKRVKVHITFEIKKYRK